MASTERKLVLCRHGETNDTEQAVPIEDPERILYGSSNRAQLSPNGRIIDAPKLGAALCDFGLRIGVAASSGLDRSVETLGIALKECGVEDSVPRCEISSFDERSLGRANGKMIRDILALYPVLGDHQITEWVRGYSDLVHTIPGAESYADVTARAVPGLHRLLDGYPDGDAVLCAHKHVNRCILAGLGLISREEVIHLDIPLDLPILLEVCDSLQDDVRRRSFRVLSGIDPTLLRSGQTWTRFAWQECQWRVER